MFKPLNKISRSVGISNEWERAHYANQWDFVKSRRINGNSGFFIFQGVNKHAVKVLKKDSGKTDPYRTWVDSSNSCDDFT